MPNNIFLLLEKLCDKTITKAEISELGQLILTDRRDVKISGSADGAVIIVGDGNFVVSPEILPLLLEKFTLALAPALDLGIERFTQIQDIFWRYKTEFCDNLSETARRYMQLKQGQEPALRLGTFQAAIDEIWVDQGSQELRDLVTLVLADQDLKTAFGEIGTERTKRAMLWTQQELDGDWKSRSEELTLILERKAGLVDGELRRIREERVWQSAFPAITANGFWKIPASVEYSPSLQRMNASRHPFKWHPNSKFEAENDPLILDSFYEDHFKRPYLAERRIIVTGSTGTGKTALAYWLTQQEVLGLPNIGGKEYCFPVYIKEMDLPKKKAILGAIADALMSYLSVRPIHFTRCDENIKRAIFKLLRYKWSNFEELVDRFHIMGLPQHGPGLRLFDYLEQRKMQKSANLKKDDDLRKMVLSIAHPYKFDRIRIILDLGMPLDETLLNRVRIFQEDLFADGLSSMILLSSNGFVRDCGNGQTCWIDLDKAWTCERLSGLLVRRLQAASVPSLNPLSNELEGLNLDQEICKVARTPQQLFNLAGRLIDEADRSGSVSGTALKKIIL